METMERCDGQPQTIAPVAKSLEQLTSVVGELNEAIKSLKKKLEPVILNEPKTEGKKEPVRELHQCRLDTIVIHNTELLKQTLYRVYEIRDSLQI